LDTFHALASAQPETLGAVYQKLIDQCREALVLQFTTKSLIFMANPDDDTISVRSKKAPLLNTSAWKRLDPTEPWKSLIGSVFGWGWITINQQGYCDGVLLSFNGLLPTVMLCVIGSSITVRRLVEEDDPIVPSKREVRGHVDTR
jgi:hypothetical protein